MTAWGISPEKVKNEVAKFGVEMDEEHLNALKKRGKAHTTVLPNNATLIFFKEKPDVALIAHESLHAVWMILDLMGVKPTSDDDEIYAYMLEFFVGKIYTNLYLSN